MPHTMSKLETARDFERREAAKIPASCPPGFPPDAAGGLDE